MAKFSYRRIVLDSAANIARAERWKAQGWRIISSSPFSVMFERDNRMTDKCQACGNDGTPGMIHCSRCADQETVNAGCACAACLDLIPDSDSDENI